MEHKHIIRPAILLALAVAIGAFGAHGLKELVNESAQKTFATGVTYHFYHALGLLVMAALPAAPRPNRFKWARRWLFVGIILFSGSLYLLALRSQIPFSVAWLGPVTPLGGVAFILGWVSLALSYQRS